MKVIILIILLAVYFISIYIFESYILCYSILTGLSYLWFVFVLITLFYIYKKRDIEYKPLFNEKYYEKIPLLRKPEQLGYLLNHKIIPINFTASIMELINKEVITIEEDKKQKVYTLVFNNKHNENLLRSEFFLLTWLFNRIGDGERVSINAILKDAKRNSGYFWSCCNEWYELAIFEGEKQVFFESKRDILEESFGYFGLTFILIIENILIHNSYYLIVAMLMTTMGAITYIFNYRRRTEEANEEYYQWLAFGRYFEKDDAFKKESDSNYLASLIIYAKLLGKSKEYRRILNNKVLNDETLLDKNILLKLEVIGVLGVINKKLEKAINNAKLKARFFTANKGSNAIRRYKKKNK